VTKQHIPLATVFLGILPQTPQRNGPWPEILKMALGQSFSPVRSASKGRSNWLAEERRLNAAISPHRMSAGPKGIFFIASAAATMLGYGKHRFTPANFSGLENP
jgi:hypothetical protein